MSGYPKCLYRDGDAFEWDGKTYDLLFVDDAEEEEKALAEGWRTAQQVLGIHPLDHDGDGRKGGSPRKRKGGKSAKA